MKQARHAGRRIAPGHSHNQIGYSNDRGSYSNNRSRHSTLAGCCFILAGVVFSISGVVIPGTGFKMGSNQQAKRTLNRVTELQSNIRHITRLAMSWFAFLVTMNYLTMGWFATGKVPDDPSMLATVALVFLLQDFLGIVGLFCVLMSACEMKRAINRRQPGQDRTRHVIPTNLYNIIGSCLILVLFSLGLAWIKIGKLHAWFGDNRKVALKSALIITLIVLGIVVSGFVVGLVGLMIEFVWPRRPSMKLENAVDAPNQIQESVKVEAVPLPSPALPKAPPEGKPGT